MPKGQIITGPSHVQGGYADFMLKTDFLRNNAAKYDEFVRLWGEEYTFVDLLHSLGWADSKGYDSPYVQHAIDTEDKRTFKIGSIVTAQPAAGGDLVIALASTDMRTIVGDDGITRSSSRPRKDEQVLFPNRTVWKIKSKNTSVTPHQLTLTPSLKTITSAGLTAGTSAQIIAPTTAEAMGQPKGIVMDYETYYNTFGILKETNLVSGTNMTTNGGGVWENIPGLKGKHYLNGLEEAEFRHQKNKSRFLVHAQLADNWNYQFSEDFDTNVGEKSSEGFLAASQAGFQGTYDNAAGYTLADFKRADAYYRNNRLPASDIMVLQGGNIASATQDVLLELFKAYSTDSILAKKNFGRRPGVGERFSADDMFLALGFKGLRLNNYNYMFTDLTELNFPAEQGFDYSGDQYFVPMNMVRDAKNRKLSYPSLQLCHRATDGYSRENEVWNTGSAPSRIVNTDQFDVNRSYFRSEVLLRTTAGGQIYTQKASNVDA